MEDSPSLPPLPTRNPHAPPINATNNYNGLIMELNKALFSYPSIRSPTFRTRRSMAIAYVFTFAFVFSTIFFVFHSPSVNGHSIWFKSILKNRYQFSSFFSHYFFPNTTSPNPFVSDQFSRKTDRFPGNIPGVQYPRNGSSSPNGTTKSSQNNQTESYKIVKGNFENSENGTLKLNSSVRNETGTVDSSSNYVKGFREEKSLMSDSVLLRESDGDNGVAMAEHKLVEAMSHCDFLDGRWVKDDDSHPLYEAGSCPFIDEPFNCFLNGRPDNGYEKFRWQPKKCNIPRLRGREMLELLRGKRLVYVGDSLNRNMWESMICLLRNSVEDKSKVFEASGREEFRSEGSYSFLFTDYNCSVEFFRSPFLVQEWEMPDTNGSKKETLRLDLVERSCDKYKTADILVFNTGHWWTHEKTSAGREYYQEGSHVYGELNVVEAFRKAMTTWARWIEANVNPLKTVVFFRGYSVSHFSGGEWYSGGKCDETKPIENEANLSPQLYPPMLGMLENVLNGMKTPVFYLNITRMSDFRKDAHPSVYRKPNLTEDEKTALLRSQDCSHWCLPGVPDTWNELVFAHLLVKHRQDRQPK